MYYASQPSLGRLKTQGKQPKRSGFIKLFTDSFSSGSKWLGCILFFGLFLPVTDAQAVTCGAPTISGTPGNGSANVIITTTGTGLVDNYWYSINNGSSYTLFNPAKTSGTFRIGGLTNGTSYKISFKKNCISAPTGAGIASNTIIVTPGLPLAPTALTATPGNGQASISFTAGADNGSAITNYSYSTDGGTSFTAFSSAQTTSPVTITGLTNGTAYSIALKEVNAIGTSTASSTVSVTPATTPSAPSALIATPGAASAVLNYTAGATGGSAITNYQYSTDGGTSFTAFSPVTTGNPLTITGLKRHHLQSCP